jgi:crotonobetainyl-CoA:carnitine CoA-transferase CaiB-like acyl-CoA transferase
MLVGVGPSGGVDMHDVLEGVKVVEVGSFVFVPLASAVLADWGAEVIKVEHPATGDPYRGLVTAGMTSRAGGVDLSFQYANRGKRSIGLDLTKDRSREVLRRLVAPADVFITNQRPGTRARLGIELDDIRAMNPGIVYVRGSGYGQHGPLAQTAALDGTAYWSRGGVAGALTPPGAERPLPQRPAFGDVMAAMTLAGGVAAALYRRSARNEPSVVDVALLNVGMWQVQRDILSAQFDGPEPRERTISRAERNPMTGSYRTKDGRFVLLAVVSPDPYWKEFCEVIDMPDLATDERFLTMDVRQQHAEECVAVLDEVFASRTYDEWCTALAKFSGAWAPVQRPFDVRQDEQARLNGFFTEIDTGSDEPLEVVSSPVTFDECTQRRRASRAPEVGEQTEEILLELSYSWDEIGELKREGVVT